MLVVINYLYSPSVAHPVISCLDRSDVDTRLSGGKTEKLG